MASISASTSLATFTTPHASSSKLPHVSLNPVYGGNAELAVAAVQGDGVWTYDVSSPTCMSSLCSRFSWVATDTETDSLVHGTPVDGLRDSTYQLLSESQQCLEKSER